MEIYNQPENQNKNVNGEKLDPNKAWQEICGGPNNAGKTSESINEKNTLEPRQEAEPSHGEVKGETLPKLDSTPLDPTLLPDDAEHAY